MNEPAKAFSLWLESETGEPLDQPAKRAEKNFCNISVTLADGRRYAMNVWTFDFLPLARFEWPYEENSNQVPAKYVHPPDLFVERLDRESIEGVVADLLEKGEMNEAWLCSES